MKRLCLSREGTLKFLLLLALVANLTWEPLTNHFSEVELASTQQASRNDCTGADKNLEQCKAVSGDARARIAQESARLRSEAEKGGKTTAAPKVNGKTEASSGVCEDCDKAEAAEKLKAAEQQVQALKKIVSTYNSDRSATETTDDDVEVDAAAADRLARQKANCEIDADGDKLTDVQEMKCLSRLLTLLKSKEDSSRRKEVTRKLESLFTRLKKDAKSDVLSKDADRRNKGEALISDMLTALNSVRFDRDSERTEMIDSLEALRAGAEARVAAADLEEDVADLETEMKSTYRDLNKLTRDFQNSCRSRNGCDREIYDQIQEQHSRVGELREEHKELADTITETQDEAIDTLEEHDLTRTELRDYASPFAKLKSRMTTIADPRKLTQAMSGVEAVPGQDSRVDGSGQIIAGDFPSDFEQVRNGTALRRGNGQFQPVTTGGIPGQTMQVPMGSQQVINQQMQQQPYSPQYMQPGMIPGQGGSLLPAPQGQMMGGMNPMMMNRPMMPGQVMPVGGQQYGQPYGPPQGGQVLPVPRM